MEDLISKFGGWDEFLGIVLLAALLAFVATTFILLGIDFWKWQKTFVDGKPVVPPLFISEYRISIAISIGIQVWIITSSFFLGWLSYAILAWFVIPSNFSVGVFIVKPKEEKKSDDEQKEAIEDKLEAKSENSNNDENRGDKL